MTHTPAPGSAYPAGDGRHGFWSAKRRRSASTYWRKRGEAGSAIQTVPAAGTRESAAIQFRPFGDDPNFAGGCRRSYYVDLAKSLSKSSTRADWSAGRLDPRWNLPATRASFYLDAQSRSHLTFSHSGDQAFFSGDGFHCRSFPKAVRPVAQEGPGSGRRRRRD